MHVKATNIGLCLQHLLRYKLRGIGRALINLRQRDFLDVGVACNFAQHPAIAAADHQHLLGLRLRDSAYD